MKLREGSRKKAQRMPRESKKPEPKRNPNQAKLDFESTVVDYIKKRKVTQTVSNYIGWVGGKARISKQLISMMPAHNEYCEVFFGGGSVFFTKPKAESNFVNDLNSNLVNMYEVMRDEGDEFWKFAPYLLYSKEMFDKAVEKYGSEDWDKLDKVRRAVFYYFIIRTSFNNQLKNFTRDQSFSIYDEYYKTLKIGEKLQGVCIDNLVFEKFIRKRIDTNPKRKKLFYLDPPYVVAEGKGYYEYLFSDYQHSSLAHLCDSINKEGHYFMLSYEDSQIIRDLYRAYDQKHMEWAYSMQTGANKSGKSGKEILITNFKTPNEQLEIL
jgi:DNA adenine methylase